MFSYQLLNHPESFSIDESRIARIFALVAESVPIDQNGILNIALLSDEEIQVLNREHRGIDSTTDVLSFHYFDDFSDT
jgi:ssRNA-specific RNase YbeY (16S rRNA maturation enzyme)